MEIMGVSSMKYEKSCGAVVYTKINDTIKYVLVQQLEGFWGFPKGHIEGNETEEENALREIYEKALQLLGFESSKRILKEANDFLLKG